MPHPGIAVLTGTAADGPANPAGTSTDESIIGRIEEWVVSTLDGRGRPTGEADWIQSLEGLTLAKRPAKRAREESSVPTAPGWARFRLSRRRGTAVVTLTDQALIKEEDLFELTGDLLSLVEAGHRRIVLDFAAVERLSSWAASMLSDAVRRCGEAEGGAVKFSGLGPDVAAIFAMTGLDPRVAVYPGTASAIDGVWPDLPELRPLPVSILAALMRAEDLRSPRSSGDRSPGGRPSLRGPGVSGWSVEDHRAMNRARLIVQDGPMMGRPVSIRGPRFTIGRGPECQLRLGSATVSRAHATIERRGGRLFLRDLASTNGTILNGKPLRDREAEVRDGDRVRVGPLSFTLSVVAEPGRFSRFDAPFPAGESGGYGVEDEAGATEEFLNVAGAGEEDGLKYEVVEGTLVVTPLASDLDGDADVDGFRDALLSLFARRLPRRVVVNLAHVGHLSGRAIGVLVAHHLRLDRTGGALRICLANPRVAVLLEQVRLGMLIDYHPTVDDAVIAAWPEPAGATRRN